MSLSKFLSCSYISKMDTMKLYAVSKTSEESITKIVRNLHHQRSEDLKHKKITGPY